MKDQKDVGALCATEGDAVPCSVPADSAPHAAPERYDVPIDEAIRRIGRKKHIHTFISSSFALIGADHERDGLIEKMRTLGVEESGAQASAMGHTLVIRNYPRSPLFIEAKPAKGRQL